MPDTETIDIDGTEAQLDKIRQFSLKLRKIMLKDGKIDRDEWDILEGIETKIKEVEARIVEKRAGPGGADQAEPDASLPTNTSISGSVGKGAKNSAEDVSAVQNLLNQKGASLAVDGIIGRKTNGAIAKFQQDNLGFQDGRVDPGGQTWSALSGSGAAPTGEQPAEGGAAGGATGAEPNASDDPDPTSDEASELPSTPEEMERRVKQLVEEQIPEEVAIEMVENDEDDDVLASPEILHLQRQEVSVGCPFGEIKIKFNERGQVETAALSQPIIPGASATAGASGVFAKLEAKPFSSTLKLSRAGGNLKLEFELSASGSGMMGLGGAGGGDGWAGIGVEIEVKVSRTATVSADLDLEQLKAMAMSPTPMPQFQAAFSLPATILLSGEQSLVFGGSAPKGIISAANKISLKEYNPMAELRIFETSNGIDSEFESFQGLSDMAEDVSRQLLPMVDMFFRAKELAEEVDKLLEDPDAYMDKKRKEGEELRRKLEALPSEFSKFANEKIKELDKFVEDAGKELDEWGNAIEKTYEDTKEAVEQKLEDAKKALEETFDKAENIYDDVGKAFEDAGNVVGEAMDDAGNYAGEKLDEAEAFLEGKADEGEAYLEEKIEETGDYLEEKAKEAEKLADDTGDFLEEKAGEAKDYANEKLDEAKEKYGDAKDAIEEKADAFVDDITDIFK